MRIVAPALALLCLAALVDPALAHSGNSGASSVSAGFAHPFSGLDHLLAMVAVGAWAGQLGGRARWSVPLSFVGMMILGSLLGASGFAHPLIEAGILGSVVLFGVLIACRALVPLGIAMAVTGLFALCHGHAHGSEMTAGMVAGLYGIGFVAATALLHLAGIGIVSALRTGMARGSLRWSGAGIAATGLLLILAG